MQQERDEETTSSKVDELSLEDLKGQIRDRSSLKRSMSMIVRNQHDLMAQKQTNI